MKVALVASTFVPHPGRLERRVDRLAHGLARRGAEVEVLTHGPRRSTTHPGERVTVRRFPNAAGPLRLAVAPKLWELLSTSSGAFDIVDIHCRSAPLALAVKSTGIRPLVFTPGGPMEAVLRFPYTRAMGTFISAASQIICYSERERHLLCDVFPWASGRTHVVPDGMDAEALSAATPFETAGVVVLAADRLDRGTGVERAIAAMPSLAPEFRLVILGDGPALERLAAYAADLRVSSRVQFAGPVSDPVLHRWLRTAGVVVSLPGERGSGSLVAEARAAGASVVASDLPVHRDVAERPGAGHVVLVAPHGSPLDVADAIDEAARLSILPSTRTLAPAASSWDSVVESTWTLYRHLAGGPARSARGSGTRQAVRLSTRTGRAG
jgi:glycosyltransferase involved in cell wall biosynthesis